MTRTTRDQIEALVLMPLWVPMALWTFVMTDDGGAAVQRSWRDYDIVIYAVAGVAVLFGLFLR